ncbi:hypothetical protein EVAR_46878_1 [Eumeta japonica]|uniref:Uncharacterized protein n=1 Tax=Eumeta variegata TaxID=151549 RepID=A0A4C1XR61_EUMVA|nr:hypothetical protein EVAR_46878_1 [Eumeta japonica]
MFAARLCKTVQGLGPRSSNTETRFRACARGSRPLPQNHTFKFYSLAGVFATTTKICNSAPTGAPGGLTPRPFCALRRARPTRYGLMTACVKDAVAGAGNVTKKNNIPTSGARYGPVKWTSSEISRNELENLSNPDYDRALALPGASLCINISLYDEKFTINPSLIQETRRKQCQCNNQGNEKFSN